MSGFGDKRRPRDTGKQQDTGQSSSSSGMSRLEQHRSRAAQFTHLYQGSNLIDTQRLAERSSSAAREALSSNPSYQIHDNIDTISSNPEYYDEKIRQGMERIKEREKYELLEYQLNNLTNTNLANFRHHAARTDLAESSKILDDFVGRRISGQPQKYTPQDALEALDKIVNTRARKNATTLMYIQQELNGLRDKYLLERSTNVLGE